MKEEKKQNILWINKECEIFGDDKFCLPRAIIMAKQYADGLQNEVHG